MTVHIHLRRYAPANTSQSWRWLAPSLLYVVGISALSYCGYVVLDARLSQTEQSSQFNQALNDAHVVAANAVDPHPSAVQDSGATSPMMPAVADVKKPEPKISNAISAEKLPLGKIDIPSIGLTAMIQEGTEPRTLQRGIGHITGTSPLGQHGNVGLAGHRDTFFRKLRNIRKGDEIALVTLTGSILYRVDLISIVEPNDSQVLWNSEGDYVTLVTCYPFRFVGPAPKRFIVRARNVETVHPDDTPKN
jgi:LPXTG-site transpeptidase (sortase) family protein